MKIYDFDGKKNLCGRKIRLVRKQKHISQTDLAAKLQLAGVILERDSISRIENGTRFVADYELAAFAQILGVSVTWMLDQTERERDYRW